MSIPTPQLLSLASSLKQTGVNAVKAYGAVAGGQSLAKFTQAARISPYVLIEESLRQQPYITDVLQAATNIYAGYYLTAVAMIGDVSGVSVLEKIERVNPNREVNIRRMLSVEAFDLGLPFDDRTISAKPMGFDAVRNVYSTEAVESETVVTSKRQTTDSSGNAVTITSTVKSSSDPKGTEARPMGRETYVTAKEASNLATGKLLEVSMVIDGKTISIPTTVTLFPNVSDTESFVHILGLHEQTQKVVERWHDWRSGKISFWSDFVFMRDLVKKHRKVLVKDKSGYYGAVVRQDRNNKAAGALSHAPSLAEASNILIFSSTCARRAEALIGGELANYATREAVFETTKAMIMFIIDRDNETVKIYHSGIETANHLTLRELKVANKNSGPDVAEILKAYQLGNAPSF